MAASAVESRLVDVPVSEDDLQDYFMDKGWSDGLPVVAPTRERVERMLGANPKLNPDELVWNYMKRTGVARRPLAAGEVLQDCIDAQMKAIGENPALVRAFFRNKNVAYITD